ncbi:MAG: patatin-like phospholipase family protein [Paludibacteraceae bacterium]|nr:patatin-like phospholipase family protein [Paludibacteraceae bacterium]
MSKRVALVLGSGGARGLAHIGAIEALEEHGYTITGIAGCSMGAIIAGMYAAGQLKEAKEWFLQVDKQLILRMMDINLLSGNSLVKGQRIIEELEKVVPDRPIEELAIPCSVVATDMGTSEEVIFRSGSLFQAVRASISIPLFFEPVRMDNRVLIDGGIVSPLPLHAVERQEGDLLAAMDISGKDSKPMERARFVGILDRMNDIQIQQNTLLECRLTPPDIHAVMRQYAYNTFDFDRAEEIIAEGRRLMTDAIYKYERAHA